MRCQRMVKGRDSKNRLCGNTAIEGCEFCHVHLPDGQGVKLMLSKDNQEQEGVHEVEVPIILKKKRGNDGEPVNLKETDPDIGSLIDAISNLTIVITDMKPKPKPQKKPQESKHTVLYRAKMLLYHDEKKDPENITIVAKAHNIFGRKVPWMLMKTFCDALWETIEQERKDYYMAKAETVT